MNLENVGKIILFGSSRKRSVKNFNLTHRALLKLPKNTYKLLCLENIPHICVPYILNASDIMVLTSFFEGSPNIVKEALACNLPVISVDVGDVKKNISKFDGCQIVEDNPLLISEAIKHNLENNNDYIFESISDFSIKKSSQKLISLYKEFSV